VVRKNNNKKKQEKEKIPKIVATFVYASSQGQRTHSARTKMHISIEYLYHNANTNKGYIA
jgi:hypothetical protein